MKAFLAAHGPRVLRDPRVERACVHRDEARGVRCAHSPTPSAEEMNRARELRQRARSIAMRGLRAVARVPHADLRSFEERPSRCTSSARSGSQMPDPSSVKSFRRGVFVPRRSHAQSRTVSFASLPPLRVQPMPSFSSIGHARSNVACAGASRHMPHAKSDRRSGRSRSRSRRTRESPNASAVTFGFFAASTSTTESYLARCR